MANRLGIRFDGFDTVGETIEIARLAEENGISGLWMTEHLGYREAMASCMAFLLATRNVTVVPAAVTPYLWHPMPTAMSLATMAEVAPGRVAVAVGIGNLLDLQRSGVEVRRPVEAVADFVAALRQLWTAKPVQMQGGDL